jgi:hypothetical protein
MVLPWVTGGGEAVCVGVGVGVFAGVFVGAGVGVFPGVGEVDGCDEGLPPGFGLPVAGGGPGG